MLDTELETKKQLRVMLHDLAQPLTAMECRLFLATMGGGGDVEELRTAVQEGLELCVRMMALVRSMQERLV